MILESPSFHSLTNFFSSRCLAFDRETSKEDHCTENFRRRSQNMAPFEQTKMQLQVKKNA